MTTAPDVPETDSVQVTLVRVAELAQGRELSLIEVPTVVLKDELTVLDSCPCIACFGIVGVL